MQSVVIAVAVVVVIALVVVAVVALVVVAVAVWNEGQRGNQSRLKAKLSHMPKSHVC